MPHTVQTRPPGLAPGPMQVHMATSRDSGRPPIVMGIRERPEHQVPGAPSAGPTRTAAEQPEPTWLCQCPRSLHYNSLAAASRNGCSLVHHRTRCPRACLHMINPRRSEQQVLCPQPLPGAPRPAWIPARARHALQHPADTQPTGLGNGKLYSWSQLVHSDGAPCHCP